MLDNILIKVRALIEDIEKTDYEIFVYRNNNTFKLKQLNINELTSVRVNGEELGSGDYIWTPYNNEITIESSLATGDLIEIGYKLYYQYSNVELIEYVRSALVHISFNRYITFNLNFTNTEIDPIPDSLDEDLIALITAMVIKPDYSSYRLPNLSVTYQKRNMDLDEKISKFIIKFQTQSKCYGIFKNIEITDEKII